MIEVLDLHKSYGDTTAVEGVSFTARGGEIFGLLGPNGAGKSTTIGCISGLLTPSSGRIEVCSHNVVTDGIAARHALGIVPQEIALYEEVSARENLDYWGRAYGLHGRKLAVRIDSVLEQIDLADRAREPIKQLSGGMKRRLNFGCGIVHQPDVLLLDEPTVGVDPQSRVAILNLVRAEASRGTCVLYTTHYMEEAEKLCDRLAIIDHGHVIAQGSLEALRAQMGERDLVRLQGEFDETRVHAALASIAAVEIVHVESTSLTLSVADASHQIADLLSNLETTGADVRGTTLTQPSLESLFIKLTGEELRE